MAVESSWYGRSEPLRKNCCALACEFGVSRVGSLSTSPGGNSGLLSRGVMGPVKGEIASVLLAVLKMESVVPMSGCVVYSLGREVGLSHGKFSIGGLAKASSRFVQSLVGRCICQSTTLVRWQAQWYFWMFGRPRPPRGLGKVNLSQLRRGGLEAQMKSLHMCL